MQGLDSIDSIVRDMCGIGGDSTNGEFLRTARAVKRTVYDLNFHIFPKILSTAVTIQDNLTAAWPDDAIAIIKAGVPNGKNLRILGQVSGVYPPSSLTTTNQTFTYSGCTCTIEDDSDDEVIILEQCDCCTFHGCGIYGPASGEWYGYRTKTFQNGTYALDTANRLIKFGSGYDITPGNKILVEYQADMESMDYMLIPKKAFKAIMFGASEMLNANDPGKATYNFNRYKIEYRRLKRGELKIGFEDIVSALRGGLAPATY